MGRWLDGYKAARPLPRLWVETMWLLESREPIVVTRTIDFEPGLNIVWAKESALNDAPGLSSAGHGVGKTSLCLLMRYVLGDDAPAISTLREKASGAFPKGGVAAKVHVDGVAWLVFRTYGHSHSLASQSGSLEDLLQGTGPSNFPDYVNTLERFSVGRLAAQTLPGTNQPLKWRHLLAWCIRDQRTRFDAFYHWRDGEGLGFARPRRDPPLFVASVLGLLDAGVDKLLRDLESKETSLEKVKQQIPELERAPAYDLAHAERTLRSRVHAQHHEPLFASTAGLSVESRVETAQIGAIADEERWEREAELTEEQLGQEQLRLARLKEATKLAEIEAGIAKSLVEVNRADFERLTQVRERLEGLDGRCDHGDIEFAACEHIQGRKSAVNMLWFRDGREVRANMPELARQLVRREAETKNAARAEAEQMQRLSRLNGELRRLRVRIATSDSSRGLLKQTWEDLQQLQAQRALGADLPELVFERKRLSDMEGEVNSLRVALAQRRAQQSSRADALKSLTTLVSTRLLGAAGYARFVPGSEIRPFEVARGGEAYQVLEVLLGDIVCLLDSATSQVSSHPGFLVHDCPREADMSERLYRDFFLAASEAAAQLGEAGAVPFQFIVTTTSPPPKELRESNVALELEPGSEEKLLFKRELVPMLPGFEE